MKMKDSKMRKARSLKRAAGILALVMVLPLASCNRKSTKKSSDRKYASGKEIQETDPFFNAEINELKLPLKEGKKIIDTSVGSFKYDGGMVLAPYTIMYETSNVSALGIFDSKGNFIKNVYDATDGVVFGACTDKDGNTCMLARKKDAQKADYYAIDILDANCEVSESIPLGAELSPSATEKENALKLSVLSDGRFAIFDYNGLLIYDREGKKCFEITDPGRMLGTTIFTLEGKSYVTSSVYDMENGDDVQIKEVDISSGKLGKGLSINVPQALGRITETATGLYVSGSSGCYKINIHTGELELIFDWNDTDVGRSLLISTTIVPKGDNEFYARCRSFNNSTIEEKTYLVDLTRAEKNPHAGKKIIVVGGTGLEMQTSFVDFVSEYNSDPQNKCRAVLEDYTDEMVTGGGKAELERKVYLDVISGDGPDILLNFGNIASFQTENIMVDMNQYIDGKDGIDRSKFFDNIFRAMEKRGELYHIPIRIALSGLQANTKYISNETGWTFDEFDEASSKIPAGVSFVESQLYNDFLKILLDTSMDDFINYEKKTVNFNNDTMKKYLQMTLKYGVKEIPEDEGISYAYESDGTYYAPEYRTETKFGNGMLAARSIYLTRIDDYLMARQLIKSPSSFLGYPSSERSGMTIESLTSIGIVAASDQKDLAWDLIRSYMEYSAAPDLGDMGISVNKEVFEKETQSALEKNKEEYDRARTYFEDLVKQYGGIVDDSSLPPLIADEDIREFRSLIENATKSSCIDESIFNIIAEEAAGYFAGDRTEDDVLKNIDNRAKLVVTEM